MSDVPIAPTLLLNVVPGGRIIPTLIGPNSPAQPNVSIPGYEIACELKRGGMGVVYKAKQTGLNRTVALKMILTGSFADAETRARFRIEAEAVATLEHPNVVKVFAFGEHGLFPFLAMEFVPGGTLSEHLKKCGALPAREAATHVEKLAGAVAHAHSRGVVHRDIKPANVLLTDDGQPRLADFGLAKVVGTELTGSGTALGTPPYMSPEQAAGKTREVGTSTDVYALGAVLYELLTGRPPFYDDTAAATLQLVLTTDPLPPRVLTPSTPRDLELICLKCLEKTPTNRYPTAQALADDLTRFLSGEPISVRPAGAGERVVKWLQRNQSTWGPWVLAFSLLAFGSVSMYLSFMFLASGDSQAMTAGRAGLIGGAVLTGFGTLGLAVALRLRGRSAPTGVSDRMSRVNAPRPSSA